jgi:hypothetical protein
MSRQKLVFLTSRVPWPLEKGDKLRAWYQLRELSRHFDVTLISINEGELHPEARKNIEPHCKEFHVFSMTRKEMIQNMLKAIFTKMPMQVAWSRYR